jgi:hypothetical protein
MALSIKKENGQFPYLNKRKSNFSAIQKRKFEEAEKGVHILGGEIVESEEIQSESAENPEVNTVDKPEDTSKDKYASDNNILKRSGSYSKYNSY